MTIWSSSASTLMTSSIGRSTFSEKMSAILVIARPSEDLAAIAVDGVQAVHKAQRARARSGAGVEEHRRDGDHAHEVFQERARPVRREKRPDPRKENDVLVFREALG